MNLRTSLFQVKGFDVRQNLRFNFCNYLILVFLCKKHYFRFRLFISLFLGAFNAFQIKFGSYYSQILIRNYFRIYFLAYQVLQIPQIGLQVCKRFSVLLILIKIQTFVYCFSNEFQNPFSLQIQGTLMDSRLFFRSKRVLFLVFQRQTCYVS